jgi:hypothetical protein
MSQLISALAVGSKVKYGSYKVETSTTLPIIFKIIDKNHAGYPANSVTLLTDKIIDLRGFDAKEPLNADANRVTYGSNRYHTSNLRQWLNSGGAANAWWAAQNLTDGTLNTNNHDATPTDAGFDQTTGYNDIAGFMNNFTAQEIGKMLNTTLTVAKNIVTDGSGSETVIDQVFLLSNTEIGVANENAIVEGSLFSIFATDADRIDYMTDQGFTNTLSTAKPATVGTGWSWWLRTPQAVNSSYTNTVFYNGALGQNIARNGSVGVRPALNLASNILVSDVVDSDGCYTVVWSVPANTLAKSTVNLTNATNELAKSTANVTNSANVNLKSAVNLANSANTLIKSIVNVIAVGDASVSLGSLVTIIGAVNTPIKSTVNLSNLYYSANTLAKSIITIIGLPRTFLSSDYSLAQINDALHSSNRELKFRYDLLDNTNTFKRTLTNVLSGHVENNALATIKRIAKFTLQDDETINFLSDRIQPWILLKMPDGNFASWALGVFLLSSPKRKADVAGNVIREVDAYDLLQVLLDDKVIDRYTIPLGTNYIAALKTLLDSAGITSQNLTACASVLPASLDWAPGTDKLTIINALLGAINYWSLFFDAYGLAVAQPYVLPSNRASDYTYKDDSQSVTFPEVEQDLDLFAIPNKWVITVTEPDQSVLTSLYTNVNPASLTSTVSRGRTIVSFLTNTAVDQPTLDAKVQRQAFEDSQVYETVLLETAIMPMHSENNMLTLVFSPLGISANYNELSWGFDLVAGGRMKHSVRKVVSI